MKTFSVASFNLRNHYWDKHWDGENFPQILGDFIETEKIDFLGVQELVRLYALNLQSKLVIIIFMVIIVLVIFLLSVKLMRPMP